MEYCRRSRCSVQGTPCGSNKIGCNSIKDIKSGEIAKLSAQISKVLEPY